MTFHRIEAARKSPKDGEVTVLKASLVTYFVLSFSNHQPAHCGVMNRVCNNVKVPTFM